MKRGALCAVFSIMGAVLFLAGSAADAAGYWQQTGPLELTGLPKGTVSPIQVRSGDWDYSYSMGSTGYMTTAKTWKSPKDPAVTVTTAGCSTPPLYIEPGVPFVVYGVEYIHDAKHTDAQVGCGCQILTKTGALTIFPPSNATYTSGKAKAGRNLVNDRVVYGEKGRDYAGQTIYLRYCHNVGGTPPDIRYRYEWMGGPVPAALQEKESKRQKEAAAKYSSGSGMLSEITGEGTGQGSGGTGQSGSGNAGGTGQGGGDIGPHDPLPESVSTFTIQASRGSVEQGQEVTVEIKIWLAEDLANTNLNLTYDPKVLQCSGKPTKGKFISKALFDSNTQEAGLIRLGFASSTGLTGSETMAQIPIKVLGQPGSESVLKLELDTATSAAGKALRPMLIHGLIQVAGGTGADQVDPDHELPPGSGDNEIGKPLKPGSEPQPVPGDSDGDGTLTAKDALMALKMSLRLLPEDKGMDMDKDGRVTANDATLILRTVVGK